MFLCSCVSKITYFYYCPICYYLFYIVHFICFDKTQQDLCGAGDDSATPEVAQSSSTVMFNCYVLLLWFKQRRGMWFRKSTSSAEHIWWGEFLFFKVIVSIWISTIYFSKTQKWYQHKKKLKRMLLFEQLWYSFTSQTKQWSLFAQFLFYRPVVPVMKMFWWQFANCANRSFLIWQGGQSIL